MALAECATLAIGEVRHFGRTAVARRRDSHRQADPAVREGGLGDTLQFCRYARLCAALGANRDPRGSGGARRPAGTLEGVSEIVAAGAPLPGSTINAR